MGTPSKRTSQRKNRAPEQDQDMAIFEAKVHEAPKKTPKSNFREETHPVDSRLKYFYTVDCTVGDLDEYEQEAHCPIWEKEPMIQYDRIKPPGELAEDDLDQQWFGTGDAVLIRAEEGDQEVEYAAVILEIRALDANNCFLRVMWFNRRHDLAPELRDDEAYGEDELFPTTFMQIVDAKNIIKKLHLVHRPSEESQKLAGGYVENYWRTSYSTRDRDFCGTPMDVHEICKCNRPTNPESRIVCDNQRCGRAMHEQCLAERAFEDIRLSDWKKTSIQAKKDPPNRNVAPRRKSSSKVEYDYRLETRQGDLPDATGNRPLYLRITDNRPGKGQRTDIKARCLFCGTSIQDADEPATDRDVDMPETD